MIDWFRLLLLYLGPQSLIASAATPCTCGGRHQWYQDQVAILQVFADVLEFLQPTWHSLLNLFHHLYMVRGGDIWGTALSDVLNIFQENWKCIFLSMNDRIDPVGPVRFVEIILRHHETHRKKALKLISPIQDHFLMSWVHKLSGFGLRCLKHTWISQLFRVQFGPI